MAMPEGTEKEASERQGQNWPGKNLLPNFSMKMRVAPFVFTDHWLSMKINFFLNLGSLYPFLFIFLRLNGGETRTTTTARRLLNGTVVVRCRNAVLSPSLLSLSSGQPRHWPLAQTQTTRGYQLSRQPLRLLFSHLRLRLYLIWWIEFPWLPLAAEKTSAKKGRNSLYKMWLRGFWSNWVPARKVVWINQAKMWCMRRHKWSWSRRLWRLMLGRLRLRNFAIKSKSLRLLIIFHYRTGP